MQEVQMCQENKLVQCAVIRQLLQSSRDIPEQTVCQLITSLESWLLVSKKFLLAKYMTAVSTGLGVVMCVQKRN